jgi:hypothetical protein
MLLELKALGLLHLFVGVRVGEVYEQTRDVAGRRARVWGWNYRTLEGHVERGQMDWEVWKWLDSGDVEFRVHAASRSAHIANPFVRVGFRLLRRHKRAAFLESTKRRMRRLTELSLEREHEMQRLRVADAGPTARAIHAGDVVDDEPAPNPHHNDQLGNS